MAVQFPVALSSSCSVQYKDCTPIGHGREKIALNVLERAGDKSFWDTLSTDSRFVGSEGKALCPWPGYYFISYSSEPWNWEVDLCLPGSDYTMLWAEDLYQALGILLYPTCVL